MSSFTPINGESATTRLTRLLTMVPWLMNRQGIDIDDAARTLGVSVGQIEADLALLFVCGTPGHLPDDLIEAEWEQGHVYVRNAEEISRPLRLTRDEALSLSVGLRALQNVPGLTERDAVDRALAKLVDATGESTPSREQIQVQLDDPADETLALLRTALQDQRRLHLRYLVPSRDEITDRDVDPMRLLTADGHWYLEAWCQQAQDVRLFRLDRVESARVLDAPAHVPANAHSRDLSAGFFTRDVDAPVARVLLSPEVAWASEYYPTRSVQRNDDGSVEAEFVIGTGPWVERLVLQLGGKARILAPGAAGQRVREQATSALRNYPDVSTGPTP